MIRWTSLTAAAVAAVLTTVGTGNAGAVTVASSTNVSQRHCVIVLDKSISRNSISPQLYRYCSQSPADPRLNVIGRRVDTRSGSRVILSTDVLMIWWENASYTGNSTVIYGGRGPCDAKGYGILPSSYWMHHMSSIQGTAYCNTVQLTNIANNYYLNFSLPAHYFGVNLNDNVGYVTVWRS